jgi:hypothetical protein
MKHCLYSAARFAGDLFICCPDATQLQTDLLWVLFPLILDGCTENLSDLISLTLERAIGRPDSDEFLAKVRKCFIFFLSYVVIVERHCIFYKQWPLAGEFVEFE